MKGLLCTVPLDLGVPRDLDEHPILPKIAMVSLIKWMERKGIRREEWDFYDIDMLIPSDDEIRAYLRECKPTVVGFSATVSTTYSRVKHLTALTREVCPDAWIICGGGLAVSANALLHKTEIDICIQSDGENPWSDFLIYDRQYGRTKNYEELKKIKGLTFLDESGELIFTEYPEKIPASEQPFPDYDILAVGLKTKPEAIKNYFRQGRKVSWFMCDSRTFEAHRRPMLAGFWSTKGCVARCTFCQRSTKGYMTNDVQTMEEHVKMLKEKYNVGYIMIIDENFGSDKKHAYEVARIMKKYDMLWICGGVRCVSVNYEDAKFYQDHGCCALKFGVESGSQKMLDMMEKRFSVEQVYSAVSHCIALGIYSPLGVLVGMPGETNETVRETGEFIGKICRMQGVPPAQVGFASTYALPLPGTPLYQYGQQLGMIGSTPDEEEAYLVGVSDCPSIKTNYINLNGASLRTVLFWDIIMLSEATRTYYASPLKPVSEGGDFIRKMEMNFKIGDEHIHGRQDEADYNEVKYAAYSDKEKEELRRRYSAAGSIAVREIEDSREVFKEMQAGRMHIKKLFGSMNLKRKLRFVLTTALTRWATSTCYALALSPTVQKLPRWLLYPIMREMIYAQFVIYRMTRGVLQLAGVNVRRRNIFIPYKPPEMHTTEKLDGYEQRIQRSLRNLVTINREKFFKPKNLTQTNHELLNEGR